MSSDARRTRRPVDTVIGGYLLLSAAALLPPAEPVHWALLVVHLVAGTALVTGRLTPIHRLVQQRAATDDTGAREPALGRWARVVVDWYPLLLFPLLYAELPVLNSAAWDGRYFDDILQGWETGVFGGQPAVSMSRDLPWLWLSELLHGAYLAYFLVLYVFPVIVYLRRGRETFHRVVFAMLLAFTVHYAVFVFFPVQGPYFLYPPPGEPASGGLFYAGVQAVLGFGASSGTAFPSSHTALSTVQTANALRFMPVLAPLLAVTTLGIAVGAVYAGIHYAMDTAVGLVTGIAIALVTPRIWRWLAGTEGPT